MNKYEKLFNEIYSKTQSGVLIWTQVKRYDNSNLIFNSNMVRRQFESRIMRGEDEFKFILVEKKYEDPANEYLYEDLVQEILAINDGELIATINDSIIDKSLLIDLVGMIESKNDKAKKLFKI